MDKDGTYYYYLIDCPGLDHPLASPEGFGSPGAAYKAAKRLVMGLVFEILEWFSISVYRVSGGSEEALVLGPVTYRPKDPKSRLEVIFEAFGGTEEDID
jgi:hypothetical protein